MSSVHLTGESIVVIVAGGSSPSEMVIVCARYAVFMLSCLQAKGSRIVRWVVDCRLLAAGSNYPATLPL